MIPLLLSEVTEDERARWMRLMVLLGLAGVIIIFARDIVDFMVPGVTFPQTPPSSASCPSGSIHSATGLPCDTVRVTVQLFILARFLGIGMVAIAGMFGVVKL